MIDRDFRIEADEAFVLGLVVFDMDLAGIDEDDFAFAFGCDLCAGVAGHGAFQAGTDDRSLGLDDRDCLAHHVGTHQGAVGVVVFQERDEGGCDGGHLVGGHVHQVDALLALDREVGFQTALDAFVEDVALVIQLDGGLGHDLVLLLFGAEIDHTVRAQVHPAVAHAAVRGLDEAQVVDLGIDAERGDQADVRTFRRLDRAEAAVVRVVHVADLETGTVAGKTARTQGGETAFVRHLGQRVGLVHELGQLAGGEEAVDHAGEGLGIDQVHRREDFVVAHVHPFADGAGHAGQAHAELVGELFADRTDTAVAQVVDVIDRRLRVDELDQVADDLDDVFLRQDADVRVGGKVEFPVEAETAHLAQVISLVGEEELVDDVAGRRLIRRFRVAQRPGGVEDGFFLRVGLVFLEGVVDDGEIVGVGVLPVDQDGFDARFEDFVDMSLFENRLAVHDDVVAFDIDDLAGVLVHEVLVPGLQDTGRELAADAFLEVRLVYLDLFGQSEDVEDRLVAFKADGAQQGGDGEFLLAVDVGVHHVVDVGRELDPGTLEGDDARRVELGAVGVHALAEEYARRAVQLGNDDTFGTVDDEGSAGSHVRDGAQIDVGDHRIEVFVFLVRAIELELGLERHVVGEAHVEALVHRVARRVDEVVDELQDEVVAGIGNRENFLEHFVKPFVLAVLSRRFELEEIAEGLQLDFQKIRIIQQCLGGCECNPLIIRFLWHFIKAGCE